MLQGQYNWGNLIQVILLLTFAWVILYALREICKRTHWFGKFQTKVLRVIEILILLFEPVTVLLIGATFVLINPPLHGLILLLIILGGFFQFRNYISGRIVLLDKNIREGKKLRFGDSTGVIHRKEQLGLFIKNNQGIEFINYSSLLDKGFLLLADDDIGGYYSLKVEEKEQNTQNHTQYLSHLLLTAPYLDYNYKPEIAQKEGFLKVQVSVKEKQHLSELQMLIEEHGYTCSILNNVRQK